MGGFFANRVVADRYRIETPIGHGAFATVFCARHVHLGTPVALKVLSPSTAPDPEIVARFRREATATARLDHPNIVHVMDFGEDPELGLFIVMEFLQGETLHDRLERADHLSVKEALGIAFQIADGLAEAHKSGVIHRDVKPANVFLLPRRPTLAKLLDFGIAGLLCERDPALTCEGTLVGSPAYMSPEQARGERPAPSSDVYAVGVLLYEMVTGRRPFEAPSALTLLSMHLETVPEPPSEVRRDLRIPDALDALILRCLAKGAADRYPTMAALRDELARLAAAAGALVPSVHRATPAAPLPAVPAPGHAAAASPTAIGRRPSPAAPPEEPPRRSPAAPLDTRPTGLPVVARLGRQAPRIRMAVGAVVLAVLGGMSAFLPGSPGPSYGELEAAQAVPAAAAPRLGYRVDSVPSGALLREADRTLGETPLELLLDPAGAPRTFRLEREGYRPVRFALDPRVIAARGDDMVIVDLARAEPLPCDLAAPSLD